MKKLYNSIFSTEEVNRTRQFEIDMAKVFILIWLPFIHVVIQCCSDKTLESGVPFLFDSVIGGPLAAPMFMFTMGCGIVYARKRNPNNFIKHAIGIGIAGIILNICRFLIPFGIGYLTTKNYDYYIEPLVSRMMTSDIFQFAFFSLIIIALFIKFRVPKWAMLLISIIFIIIGNIPFILGQGANDIDTGNYVLNMILGYFIPTEDHTRTIFSDFPIVTWLIFPICGYIFATHWVKAKNKDKFYAIVSPICLIATAIYFAYGITHEYGMFGPTQNCYYHMIWPDTIICMVAIFSMLGLWHLIGKLFTDKMKDFTMTLSRCLTPLYCIHWVFVMVITNLFIFNFGTVHGDFSKVSKVDFISVPWQMFISACIVLVSALISIRWKKYREKRIFGFNK